MPCLIDNCERTGRLKRGYCNTHYLRYKKFGDPLAGGAFQDHIARGSKRICIIEGCYKKYIARGWCHNHYKIWQKRGDPLALRQLPHEPNLGQRSWPEYGSWRGMKERCNNPKHKGFKYYGERHIKVCDRWDESFLAFYKDMGTRPTPKHSIDRIDVNGNYEPNNCRWSTPQEQRLNQRRQN